MNRTFGRWIGAMLVVGGVLDAVAGLLHPQGAKGDGSFHATIAAFLRSPHWVPAHWVGLAATVILGLTVWLLLDAGLARGSALAQVGGRLFLLGTMIMMVELAVEVASKHETAAYAAGQPTPLVALTEPLQSIGWPAVGVGIGLFALGMRALAPRWVAALAALGGVLVGAAGPLTMGVHHTAAGPLFVALVLCDVWFVWAGVGLALGRRSTLAVPSARTPQLAPSVGASAGLG